MSRLPINRIWKQRRKKKMGQKTVARLIGHRSTSQFSKWERGRQLPNLRNAFKLACILDAPVESLFENIYRDVSKDIKMKQKPNKTRSRT